MFLASPAPTWKDVHVFDFFAGPGTDVTGVPGSPLRVLEELKFAKGRCQGWTAVRTSAHFFDADRAKIEQLRTKSKALLSELSDLTLETEAWDFKTSFSAARPVLGRRDAAKLVLIDQFGVDVVSDDV